MLLNGEKVGGWLWCLRCVGGWWHIKLFWFVEFEFGYKNMEMLI